MIDSVDTFRMQIAKNELQELLQNKGLIERDVPVLFYANKQDMLGAQSAAEISNILDLHDITDRSWKIQACSAKSGDGVEDGMNWISQQI